MSSASLQQKVKSDAGRMLKVIAAHRVAMETQGVPTVSVARNGLRVAFYDKDSYRQAIERACEKAFPIPLDASAADVERWKKKYFWAPNRLRHTAGTEIRKKFGIEQAQAVLGHARLNTTQIYAEKNLERAVQVIKEVG